MIDKIKFFIKKCVNLCLCITYIIPRSKDIVVCGGWFGKKFSDNSKAMYLFLKEHQKELNIKHLFFVVKDHTLYEELKNKGVEVLMANSPKGIWYQLRAKYHIVDQGLVDVVNWTSIGARRINLWHGFPMKKIRNYIKFNHMTIDEVIAMTKKQPEVGNWHQTYNLVQSQKQLELHQYAFGFEKQYFIKSLYPRIFYMMECIKPMPLSFDESYLETLKSTNKKIIGYFPTFRDRVENNDECVQFISTLEAYAKVHDAIVLTKMHFASKTNFKIKNSEVVINLDDKCDVYDYLKFVDVLISDYSSLVFDYLYLNKPMIYYAFDLDFYKYSDRGLLFEYEKITAGEIVYDKKEINDVLDKALNHPNDYMHLYQDKKQQLMEIIYDKQPLEINSLFDLWKQIEKIK